MYSSVEAPSRPGIPHGRPDRTHGQPAGKSDNLRLPALPLAEQANPNSRGNLAMDVLARKVRPLCESPSRPCPGSRGPLRLNF
jgi:hypothetical protein